MRASQQRGIGLCVLVASVATASCSLIFGTGGFDSKYVDAGDSGLDARDAITDAPGPERSDAPPDAPPDVASPTMPLFHYRRVTKGSGNAAVSVMQPGVAYLLDSGAAHAFACPDNGSVQYFDPSTTLGSEALSNGPYRYGQLAMSSFHSPDAGRELPPGSSRFAFMEVVPDAGDGGKDYYQLLVAGELADCDASHPAVRVDDTTAPANAGKAHVLPRFSPDGTRIAYLDLLTAPDGGARPRFERVVTTGVDGLKPNTLWSEPPFDPKRNQILWGMPPAWIALGSVVEVVWLEGPDPSCTSGCGYAPFQLNFATDAPGVFPTYGTVVTCPSGPGGFSQIAELAVFGGGSNFFAAIVASTTTLSTAAPSGAMDIYIAVYGNLAYPTIGCSAFMNATHLGRGGAIARDMAVSPGGSFIAYAANAAPALSTGDGGGSDGAAPDGGKSDAGAGVDITSPTHIWLMAPTTDGSAIPKRCSSLTDDPSFDDFGPQWFNDGKLLVWTRAAHPPTVVADTIGGLWQADVDPMGTCTSVGPVLKNGATDGGTLTVIAPANTTIACNVGVGRPRPDSTTTASAACGLAIVVAGGGWRKRRRRK